MKTVSKKTLSLLSLTMISISFTPIQSKAGMEVLYVCQDHGCRIQNNVQTMPAPEELRAYFLKVIKRPIQDLIDKNLNNQIQGLSLPILLDEVSSVEFKIVHQGYIAPQGRFAGLMYKTEEKTVYMHIDTVKELSLPKAKISLEDLLLHETLGALGYIDDDYQISSLLMALKSLNQDEVKRSLSILPRIKLDWNKRLQSPSGPLRETFDAPTKRILIEGGSTTVGGGGDPLMALIKARLIAYAIINQESQEMINFIIQSLRIERPMGHQDFQQNNLVLIRNYPLSYNDFLLSIKAKRDLNRLTILIGVDDYHTPLIAIESHLLDYLKKNNFMGTQNENK